MEKASFINFNQFTSYANSMVSKLIDTDKASQGHYKKLAKEQIERWRSLNPIELAKDIKDQQRRELAAALGRLTVFLFEPLVAAGSESLDSMELIQWNLALDSAFQGVLGGEPLETSRRQFQAVTEATSFTGLMRSNRYQQGQVDEMLLHLSARAGVAFAKLTAETLQRVPEQKARQIKRQTLGELLEDALMCAGKVFNGKALKTQGDAKWAAEKAQFQLLWFINEVAMWQESADMDAHPLLRFAFAREEHPLRRAAPRRSFEAVKVLDGRMDMIHLQSSNFVPTPYHPLIRQFVPAIRFKEIITLAPQIIAEARELVRPQNEQTARKVLAELSMLYYEVPKAF